jgi:HK97 family phage major capsid protein/ATP-dependent Clp endopeptidase proteolytic subunit ClpP
MIRINSVGISHAEGLISQGKIDYDSDWEFTAEDGNKLLGPKGDDWNEYKKWFIAEDTDANENTKNRYKFPFGKNGKIYRRGVIAAKQRAAQQGYSNIADAADSLLQKIDKKKEKAFYRIEIKNQVAKNETETEADVYIYDEIGDASSLSETTSAKNFIMQMQEIKADKINLHINSPGGNVFDGLAIYNFLKTLKAYKTVYIDGLAASIASVVVMAGDKVIMPSNAFLMIHEPYGFVVGTSDDMKRSSETLDKISNSLAEIYSKRSGLSIERVKQMMKDETWLTAKEAKELGFIDEISDAIQIAAKFELNRFHNVPDAFKDVLTSCTAVSGDARVTVNLSQDKAANQPITNKTNKGGNTMNTLSRENVREILEIAKAYDCIDLAQQAISEGKSVEEFKLMVFEKKTNAKKAEPLSPTLSTAKEIKKYSILSAIRSLMSGENCYEREVSDEYAKKAGLPIDKSHIYIPPEALNPRAALANYPETAGGYLVPTELRSQDLIEYLRNKAVIFQAGARLLDGLVGNVAIPKIAGGATAYWVGEAVEITESNYSLAQVILKPKTVATRVNITRALALQTSNAVEAMVRDDMNKALAVAISEAAIKGSGSEYQPLGIFNTSGVSSVTFGGTATYGKIVEFETDVESANVNIDPTTTAYLIDAATKGKWKTIKKDNFVSEFLFDKGMVNEYRALVTNSMPNHKVLFGDFSNLLIGQWGGLDLMVNPYSNAKNLETEIIASIMIDVAVRYPGAFAISTDAGNQ